MPKYLVDANTLGLIADKIREKTETNDKLTTDEILTNIDEKWEKDNLNVFLEGSLGSFYENANISKLCDGAFAFNYDIESVSFPECLEIGNSAFYCFATAGTPPKLGSIYFPKVESIGKDAFIGHSFTNLSFPNCTDIGQSAFYRCSNIRNIYFPKVSRIGSNAFYWCTQLNQSLSFPECITVGSSAFNYCKITGINLPMCQTIYNYAFGNCSSLSTAFAPECTSIKEYAFYGCNKLENVSFPKCTNLGSNCFRNCSNLTILSFPKCSLISGYAFTSCSKLLLLDFLECKTIGSYAFSSCTSLASLVLGASSVCTLVHSNALSRTKIASKTGYIYVPSSLVDAYKTATNWTYFSTQISAIEDMPTE